MDDTYNKISLDTTPYHSVKLIIYPYSYKHTGYKLIIKKS